MPVTSHRYLVESATEDFGRTAPHTVSSVKLWAGQIIASRLDFVDIAEEESSKASDLLDMSKDRFYGAFPHPVSTADLEESTSAA